MLLETIHHGTREYDEKDIIVFQNGIPGFEDKKKFIIFPVEDNEVFSVLHSVEDSSLGFILVSPFYVDQTYEFELEEDKVKELKIDNPEELLVMNTVTLDSSLEKITANMKAPMVINIKSNLGEQIIISNENYLIKHSIFKK